MKTKLKTSMRSLMLSTLVGSPIVLADDIEIYTGTDNEDAIVNIIFMMDTSGSMDSKISGTNETRMRQAKDALKAVVNDLPGDMRVGLGRYNTPAGSILTPARALDEVIELDITIQPTGNDSDAYEREGRTEETIVYSDYLKFEPSIGSDDTKVASDDYDAEQCVNGSTFIRAAQYASFPYDGSNCRDMNAFIFQDLEIPQGATIISASMNLITENASKTVTVDMYVEDDVDPTSFKNETIYNRDYLSDSIPWTFFPTSRGTSNESPELKDLVQQLVNNPNWDEDSNALSFNLVSRAYIPYSGYNTYYTAYNSSYKPEFKVKYRMGDQASNLVGIKFDEIQIPSGAAVSTGMLKLKSSEDNGTGELTVAMESDKDSENYKEENDNISDRSLDSMTMDFTFTNWSKNEYREFNVLPLIEKKINSSDWCGGSAINFIITSNDAGAVYSVDSGSENSPELSFRYLGGEDTACVSNDKIIQVEAHEDDSEEDPRGNKKGRNNPYNSKILTRSGGHSGFIFRDVDIPSNAKVTEAYIQLTAYSGNDTNTNYAGRVYGVKSNEYPIEEFDNDNYHITKERGAWTSGVSWTIGGDLYTNKLLTSSDLSSIIEELIQTTGYRNSSEKSLEIVLENSANKTLKTYSYDGNPAKAAKLVVRYEGASSASKLSTTKTYSLIDPKTTTDSPTTVRDYLIQLIDQQPADGSTPIEGSLYETTQYFKGAPVNYGRSRNPQTSSYYLDTARMSGEDTYTGGTIVYPNGCSPSSLNDNDCGDIYIAGNPVYISPITDNVCETNNVILITDGYPTEPSNYSKYGEDFWGVPLKTLIQNETGVSCNDAWSCSNAWVSYMYTTDFKPEKQGVSNINTHIVGFTELDSSGKLKALANNGGGVFVPATNTENLVEALNLVIGSIMEIESTMATPGVAVNQDNRTLHLSDIYYSVFQPSIKKAWNGNLKKYRIDSKTADIVDKNGDNAVNAATGFFEEGTTSFWSKQVDGGEVEIGGAANQQTLLRNVYTYTGNTEPVEIDLTDDRHTLLASNNYLTKTMFGNSSMENTEFKLLKEWASGIDVYDDDSDGDSNDSRRQMGDPLHSRPILVSYGNDVNVVYVSTNEGYLHAIDSETGAEVFSFVPQELLPALYEKFVGGSGNHIYGLDSSWIAWSHDKNGDGIISSSDGDKMYLYSGMRRGGDTFYALDVTNPNKPKLKFTKSPSSTGFEELGQTWSEPVLTKIKVDGEEIVSLIFGAGYDQAYDLSSYNGLNDSLGGAVYILNAENGKLIYKITGSDGDGDLKIPGMDFSIVSRPYFMDLDGSGHADVIYITDLASQIIKVSINQINKGVNDFAKGKIIAKFGKSTGNLSSANNRHMYDAISVAPIRQNGEKYMGIVAGTGYRAHPLDKTREDVIVVIKDKEDYYETGGQKMINSPILFDDLADLTSVTDSANALNQMVGKNGYYLNLREENGDYIGEKMTGEPIIYDNQIILNTYVPNKAKGECVPIIGYARGYQFDLHSGTPNADKNEDGSLSQEDRYQDNVSAGIANGSKLIYTEDGVLLLTNTKVEKLGEGGSLGVSKKRWYIEKK